MKLLATDNILRKLIIKAESFKILVDKKELKKFVKRMKELGYLVEEWD